MFATYRVRCHTHVVIEQNVEEDPQPCHHEYEGGESGGDHERWNDIEEKDVSYYSNEACTGR